MDFQSINIDWAHQPPKLETITLASAIRDIVQSAEMQIRQHGLSEPYRNIQILMPASGVKYLKSCFADNSYLLKPSSEVKNLFMGYPVIQSNFSPHQVSIFAVIPNLTAERINRHFIYGIIANIAWDADDNA